MFLVILLRVAEECFIELVATGIKFKYGVEVTDIDQAAA